MPAVGVAGPDIDIAGVTGRVAIAAVGVTDPESADTDIVTARSKIPQIAA